jgi:pimeloyl-ACP methyl ester carboxylesterase
MPPGRLPAIVGNVRPGRPAGVSGGGVATSPNTLLERNRDLTGSHASNQVPTDGWAGFNDLQVHYLYWDGDNHDGGEPVVLALHGLASSAHWYWRLARRLADRCRIIAPDQRGHGRTTQAFTGYDWQTLASDAAALLDHFEVEQAIVLGHSWGGHVASNLAARFPGRVSRLVMIDGGFQDGHLLADPTWENFRSRFRPRDVSGTKAEWLDRLREQMADCWGDDLERTVLTMVYEDEAGLIRDVLHPDHHAQVLESMWNEPPSVVLPRVACPTLVIPAGPRPQQANSEFARMREVMVAAAAQLIPDCTVHWIPDTMHDIGYHKPDELARVIAGFIHGSE